MTVFLPDISNMVFTYLKDESMNLDKLNRILTNWHFCMYFEPFFIPFLETFYEVEDWRSVVQFGLDERNFACDYLDLGKGKESERW